MNLTEAILAELAKGPTTTSQLAGILKVEPADVDDALLGILVGDASRVTFNRQTRAWSLKSEEA